MTNILATLSTLSLADRYAILKADADAINKALEVVKAEIKATGLETIEGERAVVTVALSERATLDPKAAKALLTDEEIAACTKVTLVETLRVKPKTGVTVLA
jgi:2-hydroxychromene-2-carboxylate isomerase